MKYFDKIKETILIFFFTTLLSMLYQSKLGVISGYNVFEILWCLVGNPLGGTSQLVLYEISRTKVIRARISQNNIAPTKSCS